MKNFLVSSFLIMLSAIVLFGCLGGSSIPPLTLSGYTRIAIAPFSTEKESAPMSDMLPYDIGIQLDLKFKKEGKIEWIYYQSEALQPVRDKLTELQLSPEEIYRDPARAAKVGEALGADLILVGYVSNPRIEKNEKRLSNSGLWGKKAKIERVICWSYCMSESIIFTIRDYKHRYHELP